MLERSLRLGRLKLTGDNEATVQKYLITIFSLYVKWL